MMRQFNLKFSLLASALFIVGCNPQGKNPSSTKSTQVTLQDEAHYAQRGADLSWPGESNNQIQLAENLHAKNFYIIVDGSGSMEETGCGNGQRRIDAAKDSISQFVKVIPKDANAGMYVFDYNGKREVFPLLPTNVESLEHAISDIRYGNKTPLGESLSYGYSQLTSQAKKQQGYGEYNLVVITDGAASDESLMKQQIKYITNNSPVNIHTIGFCLDSHHALNQQGIVNYRSAKNSQELISGLKAVLAESENFDETSFKG